MIDAQGQVAVADSIAQGAQSLHQAQIIACEAERGKGCAGIEGDEGHLFAIGLPFIGIDDAPFQLLDGARIGVKYTEKTLVALCSDWLCDHEVCTPAVLVLASSRRTAL